MKNRVKAIYEGMSLDCSLDPKSLDWLEVNILLDHWINPEGGSVFGHNRRLSELRVLEIAVQDE